MRVDVDGLQILLLDQGTELWLEPAGEEGIGSYLVDAAWLVGGSVLVVVGSKRGQPAASYEWPATKVSVVLPDVGAATTPHQDGVLASLASPVVSGLTRLVNGLERALRRRRP